MSKASPELLRELWSELLRSLLGDLKGTKRPSVEHLQVTRKFLRDNGQLGMLDADARKRVEKLHRQYLQALVDAFESPHPPTAALLGEARQFLSSVGHHPELPAKAAGLAAAELLAMKVPFEIKQ